MDNSLPCQLLGWDSEFFGFRIARVAAGHLTRESLKRIEDWCAAERIRCLYFLARGDDCGTAELASEHGFRFVDIRTQFERQAEIQHAPAPGIRPAAPEDIPALAEIARRSHTDSRFYYDLYFPRERCDALYSTWIEKSCQGWAKAVLVAERERKLAGYVTCDWTGQTGQIGLIAVADWARGGGLGQTLVRSSLQLFRQHGVRAVNVVTQGRNIHSQRLYQRCGFLIASVQIWYHRWFSSP
jgi:dTDP-4-amino-4,6-dideoxy-D-galactose acyltransferase